MSEDEDEKKKDKLRKGLEKEALEDIKPAKGSPDSLKKDEPSLDDVIKKGKKSEKEDKERK